MSDDSADVPEARAHAEAAAWFARLRGPDGAQLTAEYDLWRAADPAHAAAYDRLLQRWDQSVFLTNTALGRRRDLRLARHWSRQPAVRYIGGAALFALLALVGIFALDRSRSLVEPTADAVTVASAREELRSVRLDDGSRVTLDADTSIDVAFTGTERRLRLGRGRVRIDAAADVRPFVIDAPGGALVAGQSLFDVRAGQGLVEVALLRGSLEVESNRPGGKRRRAVPVGQYVLLQPSGKISAPKANAPGQLLWTNGMVSFSGERLADAVAMMNRFNARQIEIGSADIADLRITGAFHARNPEGFADAIAAMFGLMKSRSPAGSIVLRKKT